MKGSPQQRADSWPYERHDVFESKLRKQAAAFFRKKGYAVQTKYAYILADLTDWPRNILLKEVADYIVDEKKQREEQKVGFPLHKYLHHGLSSQAMLFNLVGPLVVRNDLEPILAVTQRRETCRAGGQTVARFEVENREVFNEDFGQPTSIDLVVEQEGLTLFIEAKFVEREFGGCSVFSRGDCDGRNPSHDTSTCYLQHIGRKYWQLIQEHQILGPSWERSPVCPLACYYQFFREMLFALDQGGLFVLLHDERNPTFRWGGPDGQRGIFAFLVSMLPETARSRVRAISTQQLLRCICATDRHNDWVPEFAEKYDMQL